MAPAARAVKEVLIDSGFVSEAAVVRVESASPGLTVLAAIKREPHGRTVAQLERPTDPPAPRPDAPFTAKMIHPTATAAGRAA